MRRTKLIRPQYAQSFRCLGPACEDSCCIGWRVDIDATTYRKYQALPPSPLRTDLDTHIIPLPATKPDAAPGPLARIQMPPTLSCPFLDEEHLCRIQVEHGPEYLCTVCATFPRAAYVIDKLEDLTLTLSCPEAARMVLLNPNFLTGPEPVRSFDWEENLPEGAAPALRTYFWALREFALGLIRNRNYPLWQRLFLLGSFARRLEALVTGKLERGFPALLHDFSAAVASGSLVAPMEAIPADLALQLEMVMQLVKLRIGEGHLQPRLNEILNTFADGAGFQPQSAPEGQTALYALAYEKYYAPFFRARPHILENMLINAVMRRLFPFGAKLLDLEAVPEPAREFTMLATEFSLVKGVLIGVAGFYKEAFSEAHVVKAVQVISKYFEHNSVFLARARELLAARHLDDARGLTMLVRN